MSEKGNVAIFEATLNAEEAEKRTVPVGQHLLALAFGREELKPRHGAPSGLLGFCYCFSVGEAAGGGDESSSAGVVPLSSDAPTQSPAQILVPLTVPTSLQPIGVLGFA